MIDTFPEKDTEYAPNSPEARIVGATYPFARSLAIDLFNKIKLNKIIPPKQWRLAQQL
jgi:hypothetical protein